VICGTDGDDHIEGGAGDDQIRGGAGNDVLRGGEGHDDLDGGEGNDEVDGGDLEFRANESDRLECGSGQDIYIPDPNDEVAADCEQPAPEVDAAMSSLGSGDAGPADAPARTGSSLLGLGPAAAAGLRHPVTATKRKLVLENGKIELVLNCQSGSVNWQAHATIFGRLDGKRTTLASAKFQCEILGPKTIELDPTPKLERLLQGHDEVHARLVVLVHGKKLRMPVTITS
jgi:hypothetical protein